MTESNEHNENRNKEDNPHDMNHENHSENHRPLESHPETYISEQPENNPVSNQFKIGNAETVLLVIGVMLLAMVFYNAVKISNLDESSITGNVVENSIGNSVLPSISASEFLPSGVPEIYRQELGLNFDDVSGNTPQKADKAIGVLSNLDRTITLTGDDLDRYIKIGSEISCEHCCGAKSIIKSDGSSACGCAHSFAMRGLAKYLLTKHGNEYTNDEILEELGKWKVLFFPGIHETKAAVLKEKGIELNYINLASNKYRGIEKGQSSGGGMVGGC